MSGTNRPTLATKITCFYLIVALAANLLLANGLGARKAFACSCGVSGGPKASLRGSAAVFLGNVTSIGILSGNVTFSVKEAWKGVSKRSVVVRRQGGDLSPCGFIFERGESYLVYAYREEERHGSLATNICTATKPLAEAKADLRVLGPPTVRLSRPGPSLGFFGAPATGTVSVALLAVWRLRRSG